MDVCATYLNTIPYFPDSEPVARVRVKPHIEKAILESVMLSRDRRKVPVLERKAFKHQRLIQIGRASCRERVFNWV